jgi:hypothetical protein
VDCPFPGNNPTAVTNIFAHRECQLFLTGSKVTLPTLYLNAVGGLIMYSHTIPKVVIITSPWESRFPFVPERHKLLIITGSNKNHQKQDAEFKNTLHHVIVLLYLRSAAKHLI